MIRCATSLALAASAMYGMAASFVITDAYTSKQSGSGEVKYTPYVGEDYRLTVEFDQTGVASAPYNVHFDIAGQTQDVSQTNLSAGHKIVTAEIWVPLDDKVPFKITVDSAHGGPTKSGSFTPTPPSAALEFYDPVKITGYQSQTYNLTNVTKYEFEFMSGRPDSDGWQKELSATCMFDSLSGQHKVSKHDIQGPYLFPVYYSDTKNMKSPAVTFRQDFTLQVSAQRVNPDKLRQVTWNDLKALDGINVFKHFNQPESVIQSNDPAIAKFVKDTLGSNYKSKLTPYDAARKMFMAVLKRCTYYYPKPGETDKRPATAVDMLKKGFGDCGGFSILLVACYRNLGIPARTACGAWVGDDAGHCWCEMWFPHAGWIVSDGSAGNYWSENGSYAYYFGFVPDLNARFAFMRGNTFKVNDASASWLQGPMWPPIIKGGATLGPALGYTHAEVATDTPAPKKYKERLQKAIGFHPKWNMLDIVRPGIHVIKR
ncbi:MAG TPA: transglutaminase-like domain-containing protein [Fimbriimonadaceae bacterium]|nr:transglutaminase-like domain-containing protein [Fimbriimonadaceae bacterium]